MKTASTAQAFPDLATLDLYTYYVAGVVGEFWTKIHKVHMQIWQPHDFSTLCALGVRLVRAADDKYSGRILEKISLLGVAIYQENSLNN